MRLHTKRPLGRKKIAALALAVCAAAVCALSLKTRGNPAPLFPGVDSAHVTPYTLEQRQTFTPAGGGQPFVRAVKVRRQKADGTFLLSHTYYQPDGTVEAEETGVGHTQVGLFRVDERRELFEFVAGVPDEPTPDAEVLLRESPDFLREDSVMGQRTLVTRHPQDPEAVRYTEIHRAPALQYLEVKTLVVTPSGEEVTEPVRLYVGEPDAGPFESLRQYPKSFARFEERMRRAEREGDADLLEALRRLLARARQ